MQGALSDRTGHHSCRVHRLDLGPTDPVRLKRIPRDASGAHDGKFPLTSAVCVTQDQPEGMTNPLRFVTSMFLQDESGCVILCFVGEQLAEHDSKQCPTSLLVHRDAYGIHLVATLLLTRVESPRPHQCATQELSVLLLSHLLRLDAGHG